MHGYFVYIYSDLRRSWQLKQGTMHFVAFLNPSKNVGKFYVTRWKLFPMSSQLKSINDQNSILSNDTLCITTFLTLQKISRILQKCSHAIISTYYTANTLYNILPRESYSIVVMLWQRKRIQIFILFVTCQMSYYFFFGNRSSEK